MREIKFRVWDGHTKSFFCTEGTHYLPKLECDIDGILTITPIDNSYQIMQSTGLKDKNGVEIYEFMELDSKWEVDWLDGRYILCDISTGDIIDLNYESKYEITRDYTKV